MKRFYKVLLPALLLALALGGCKSRDAAATTDGSAYSESSRTVLSTQSESPSEDAAETSAVAPGESTEKAGVTTKPGATTAKPDATTTKPGATTTKPAATVTAPGAATTKPATTTKPAATTKPGTTTTKPAATTKPTTTKPGAPASNPAATTTKPAETTAAPVAKGDRIAGKITYLNEANDYAAKLTAEKLKYFGMPADKQKDVLAHPEKYAFYSLDIALENKESVPVTLYYLDVGGNGTGDVYINGDTSGDIGLPVGGTITNRFYVIAPAEDADGSVLSKVRGMNLRIRYAATLEDDSAPVQYVYSKIG